jgi:biotin synthase
VLGEFNSMVFMAGADGLLVGNYLTQKGRRAEDDLNMINSQGLSYR